MKCKYLPRIARIVADYFLGFDPRVSVKSAVKVFVFLCVLCVLCGEAFSLDRTAFTFVTYDLEVRVDPGGQALSARGKIHLRNDSNAAQSELALQISSSLTWRLVNVNGNDVQYSGNTYMTDIDHTGSVSEVIVKLPAPVAPGGEVDLEVGYSGKITRDAKRLTEMGVPEQIAGRSDWDRIEEPVTAVRGIGYVAWYPMVLPAVQLSDPEYFSVLADWKDRERASSMRLKMCWVSEEDDLSVVSNGALEGVNRNVVGATDEATTHSGCSLYSFANIGGTVPSFAIANYSLLSRPAINVYHVADQASLAQEYVLAAEKVLPLDVQWFGDAKEKVTVVQLPDAGAATFESGPLLFTPLAALDRKAVEERMIHQLVHASFRSSRPWIEEGLAHFAMALEREQDGRAAAIALLDQSLPTLQEAEKQPAPHGLATSSDSLMYRAKAMFVWWMLRDMVGDAALQRALKLYRPADDKSPSYIPDLIAKEAHRDLSWFFDDWVYRDRGLPDFHVVSAFPRQTLGNSYVVALTIENTGAVSAEVPVIVRTAQGDRIKRLLVKAHDKTVDRIEVPAPPTEVIINDGSVPESDMTNNSFVIPKTSGQ